MKITPIIGFLLLLLLIGIVDADPDPVAAFSANVTTGCAPLHVAFTDATTRSPINWDWYWWSNETKTSDLQNPTAIFPAGTYSVRLYANTATHGDWENKTNYIATTAAPVAAFSGNPTSGTAPLSVTFTDASTNSPDNWDWYWSADEVKDSDTQSPVQSFNAGTYNVRLYVSNCGGAGSDWENKTGYITSNAAPDTFDPTTYGNWADFWVNSTSAQTDFQVSFKLDNRTGTATTDLFYTNGTTKATWEDAVWTDTSNTTLSFWGENVTQTATNKTFWIKVPTIASDNTTKIRLFYGNASKTTSYENGDATFIFWDNFPSPTINPSKWLVNNPGGYAISGGTLTIKPLFAYNQADGLASLNSYSTENTTLDVYVKFEESNNNALFGLSHNNATTTESSPRYLNSGSNSTFDNYFVFHYETSQFYYAHVDGVYDAAYRVEITKDQNEHRYKFTNNGTYIRFSKDGGAYTDVAGSTEFNSNMYIRAAGYHADTGYDGNISIKNLLLRKYAATNPFLTLSISGAAPPPTAPVASFTINRNPARIPQSITVTDTSTNTPTGWAWSWGDGTANSTTANPVHIYTTRGRFNIILTATNAGGSGTNSANYVRVVGYENYY